MTQKDVVRVVVGGILLFFVLVPGASAAEMTIDILKGPAEGRRSKARQSWSCRP